MKPEINNQSKARFFAQYYDQMVAVEEERGGAVYQVDYQTIRLIDYLLLKPLSAISDENAIEVAKILGYVDSRTPISSWFIDEQGLLECTEFVDFIRSMGYAWTWLGISVEEQVAAGVGEADLILHNGFFAILAIFSVTNQKYHAVCKR